MIYLSVYYLFHLFVLVIYLIVFIYQFVVLIIIVIMFIIISCPIIKTLFLRKSFSVYPLIRNVSL